MSRSRLPILGVLVLLLGTGFLPACGSEAETAYEQGYAEGYAEGHARGLENGAWRGGQEGSRDGARAATDGVPDGVLSHIYLLPAFLSLLVGIAIGLICQYIVLVDSKDKGRVPSLLQTGLVPGMTASFAYQLLERRWRLMARLDDWLARVARQRNARLHEIRTVRAVLAARINAASDLEELVGRKYVALASREFNRIVDEAEKERWSPSPGGDGGDTHETPPASD